MVAIFEIRVGGVHRKSTIEMPSTRRRTSTPIVASALPPTFRPSNVDALLCIEALLGAVRPDDEEALALLKHWVRAVLEAHHGCRHLLEEIRVEGGQVEEEEGVLRPDHHAILAIALNHADVRLQRVPVDEGAASDHDASRALLLWGTDKLPPPMSAIPIK